MRKLSYLAILLITVIVASCGDSTLSGAGGAGGTTPGGAAVAGVTVLTSSPSLPSDPGKTVTITAVVRDSNNVAMEGVTVILSADSGTLTVTDPVTDAGGIVTATLSGGGDPTNRPIVVGADANGVLGSVTVNVQGTRLIVSGPTALALNDPGVFNVILLDAAQNGIVGVDVDVSSVNGTTLASPTVTTGPTGQTSVGLTASAAGVDVITATALGISADSDDLLVSDDTFAITAPLSGAEVPLNIDEPVSLTWTLATVPQAGQTVTFSATRGTMGMFQVVTDVNGVAANTINANSAGFSTITASVLDPITSLPTVSTSVIVEFVADTPASIDVQASPLTVGASEQSAISATVRDINNNLVKGQLVAFVLEDTSGGQLTTGSGLTNSQGQAFTAYNAGPTTSGKDGVRVIASLQANPLINDDVFLTVAQRELFIAVGTGNSIFEPNTADYRKEWSVRVTDAVGNGVPDVNVQVGILSDFYYKGFWFYDVILSGWVQNITAGPCADEDINRDGFLQPAEDTNGSMSIEAGNIATVTAQSGVGGNFVTDPTGTGIVDIIYAQSFAEWVVVTLTATASVSGTEFEQTAQFVLPISSDDVDDERDNPPGIVSPFGVSNTCDDPF